MSIYEYKKLMKDFLDKRITVKEFENAYLNTMKQENKTLDDEFFIIINDVFEAVDCYWHECHPGEETRFEISEQQLRKEVKSAHDKLNLIQTISRYE